MKTLFTFRPSRLLPFRPASLRPPSPLPLTSLRSPWLPFGSLARLGRPSLSPVRLYSSAFGIDKEYLENLDVEGEFSQLKGLVQRGRGIAVDKVNSLLRACKLQNDYPTANKVYMLTKDLSTTADVAFYTAMLNVCSYTDQMDRAMEVYSDLMQRNIQPDSRVFSVMILGFTKSKQYQRVVQIEDAVESMQVEYDQTLYLRFIMAYISGNLLTRAEKIFAMMQGNEKIPIDISIYGIMIDALCEGSKVEEAVSLVNYLKLKGIKPNIIMYNNIIRGCRKVKNVSVAWGMFKDLEEQGLVPDDHTWHYLIDTLCVSGKVDTALKIKAMMESRGVKPSPNAYTAILVSLSMLRRINDVERYFLEMRQLGYQCPNAWKFVVECYIKTRQVDKALILVDQMIAESIKIPSMLKNILLVHCRKKNLESWYTQRFGQMPVSETLLKRESALKKYSKTFEDPRLDWDVDPETLSVTKPAKLKRDKEDSDRKEHLKNIEEEYITIPIDPELKKAMLEQQKQLAEKRKEKKPLKKKVKKLKATTKTKTSKITKTSKTKLKSKK